MTEQQYPFKDDATIVLGPGVFVAEDGSVLNWDGVNYVPQPSSSVPAREQIDVAVGAVLSNASNYPRPAISHILGEDITQLRTKVTDAVLALLNGADRG